MADPRDLIQTLQSFHASRPSSTTIGSFERLTPMLRDLFERPARSGFRRRSSVP